MLTLQKWREFSPDVLVILAQRGWQAAAGLVTLVFVAHFLTPEEQGWYYTFASLAALQIVFDMGLSVVLIQVSAHEFAGLTWSDAGTVEGADSGRFYALVRKAMIWYGIAAVCFLLAFPAGLVFFDRAVSTLTYDWRWPWAALVFAAAGNLLVLPVLAILEGSGQIREAYLVRLAQSVFGAMAIWLILARDGGLYAAAAMPAIGALTAGAWFAVRRPRLFAAALSSDGAQFPWRSEVWKLQWRMGISWLCGYLLMQIHTPLLFQTQGAVAAGRMGLSLTIANMLSLLTQSWMASRVPAMARAVSLQDWPAMDRLFARGVIASSAAFIAGAIVAACLRGLLDYTPYGIRLLPLPEFLGLLLAMLFAHMSGLLASQLRAYRREPFVAPSLIGAILMVAGVLWAAPRYSSAGIIAVMFLLNGGFGLPVTIWLWRRCNRNWRHVPPEN